MSAVYYRCLCGLWIALIYSLSGSVRAQQATPPKPVAPAYAITDLPTLGTTSEANAINNKGQIVGWTQNAPNHHRAVLWQNDVAIATLGTLGGASSEALALNDNGQVVGRAATANGKSVAFLWQDYVIRRLILPDSADSAATGINASGQIVGYRSVSRVEKAGKPPRTLPFPRAFLWQQGRMTDLYEVGTGGYSSAAGINAAGEVVGESAPGNLNSGVFVWTQPGKWNFSDYAIVGGHRGAGGTAINDAGDVVGSGMVGNDCQDRIRVHGFLQRAPENIDLGGFGEGSTRALALNNKGQVVGTAFTMQGNTEQGHRAFLWQNGTLTDLNDAVKADSGWTLEEARGINDKGQIVGVGVYEHQRHAFLLTPVPAANSTPADAGTSTPPPAAKTSNERLYEGASRGDIERMQAALRDGANINAQFGSMCESALMTACRGQNSEAVAFLLRQHPDVNLRNCSGETVLHIAARNQSVWTAEIMKLGRQAAAGLVESRKYHMMQMLIAAGANANARTDREQTPLHTLVAAYNDDATSRLELLTQHGANLNAQDHNGATPLHMAAERHNLPHLHALIRLRANPNVQDHEGRTPLMSVCEVYKDYESCKALVDAGANVNARDKAGRTALSGLVEDAANSYFEAHNDNENEFQPEYIRFPDEKVVRLLINKGANVNVPDIKGKTALQWAQILVAESKYEGNHKQAEQFARLLQNAGAKRRPRSAKSDNQAWN